MPGGWNDSNQNSVITALQTTLREIFNDYKQRSQSLSETTHTKINHYVSLRDACSKVDSIHSIQTLNRFVDTSYPSLDELKNEFDSICHARFILTEGTFFSPSATPNLPINECFEKFYENIYSNELSLNKYMKVFFPGVDTILELDFKIYSSLPKRNQSNVIPYLRESTVDEVSLKNIKLSELVIIKNKALILRDLINEKMTEPLFQKTYYLLSTEYPRFYDEIILHYPKLAHVYEKIAQLNMPPRIAIRHLIKKLRLRGTKATGKTLTPDDTYEIVKAFEQYIDRLPDCNKIWAMSTKGDAPILTLEDIIKNDLLKDLNCVETAADNLDYVLLNESNQTMLDHIPKIDAEIIEYTFDPAALSRVDRTTLLPSQYISELIDEINLNNAQEVGKFLSHFDTGHYDKFFQHDKFASKIKSPHDIGLVFVYLTSLQIKHAFPYFKNKIKTREDFKRVVENLSPAQRDTIYEICQTEIIASIKTLTDFNNTNSLFENKKEILYAEMKNKLPGMFEEAFLEGFKDYRSKNSLLVEHFKVFLNEPTDPAERINLLIQMFRNKNSKAYRQVCYKDESWFPRFLSFMSLLNDHFNIREKSYFYLAIKEDLPRLLDSLTAFNKAFYTFSQESEHHEIFQMLINHLKSSEIQKIGDLTTVLQNQERGYDNIVNDEERELIYFAIKNKIISKIEKLKDFEKIHWLFNKKDNILNDLFSDSCGKAKLKELIKNDKNLIEILKFFPGSNQHQQIFDALKGNFSNLITSPATIPLALKYLSEEELIGLEKQKERFNLLTLHDLELTPESCLKVFRVRYSDITLSFNDLIKKLDIEYSGLSQPTQKNTVSVYGSQSLFQPSTQNEDPHRYIENLLQSSKSSPEIRNILMSVITNKKNEPYIPSKFV